MMKCVTTDGNGSIKTQTTTESFGINSVKFRIMISYSFFAILSRFVIISCSFLIIPLLINHYGTSDFGLYIAFTVFWGLLNTLDFGVGGAIINEGVKGEKKKFTLIEIFLSTLSNLYRKWVYLILLGFPIAFFLLDHASIVFKSTIIFLYLAYAPVNIALTCTVNSLLSRNRQKSYILLNSMNPLFQFGLIVLCVTFNVPFNLLLLLLPVSQAFISLLFLFPNFRLKRPQIQKIGFSENENIYFRIGLLTFVSYNVDAIVISNMLNYEDVTNYSLYQKIFFAPGAVLGAVSTLIWGKIVQQRSSYVYISLFNKYIWPFSIVGALVCFFLAALIFVRLSSGQVEFNYLTGVIFSLWTLLHIYSTFASSIVNGKDLHAKYVTALIYITLLNVALSVALIPIMQINGPILASVISLTLFQRHLARLVNEN